MSPHIVIPAKAGTHLPLAAMDSRLRGNDGYVEVAGMTIAAAHVSKTSRFFHRPFMLNLGGLAEHDGGRAVFFGREVYGAFDGCGFQVLALAGL